MGVLANRDFIKMNGLGNEIVVVDLRQGTQHDAQQGAQPIAADEARTAARQEPYDQLMALYPGRCGSDALVRIYNNDGSEAGACGNGMRCVASLVSAETGKAQLNFETSAGAIACWRAADGLFTVDRSAIRTARRAAPARAVGREHGQPARDFLGR